MLRSNLKIGSTGLLSQLTPGPPAEPDAQRSYPQTCPSVGSMSRPAVEPHSRSAGRVAQLPIRVGFGFGSPSPVIGLAAEMAIAVGGPDSAAHPARITAPKSADIRSRVENMVPPGKSRFRRGTPAGTGFGNIGGQCAPRKPMQPAAFSPPVPQHQEDC